MILVDLIQETAKMILAKMAKIPFIWRFFLVFYLEMASKMCC